MYCSTTGSQFRSLNHSWNIQRLVGDVVIWVTIFGVISFDLGDLVQAWARAARIYEPNLFE